MRRCPLKEGYRGGNAAHWNTGSTPAEQGNATGRRAQQGSVFTPKAKTLQAGIVRLAKNIERAASMTQMIGPAQELQQYLKELLQEMG